MYANHKKKIVLGLTVLVVFIAAGLVLLILRNSQTINNDTDVSDTQLKPNVIVIMADDLGYGDIAPFKSKTPAPHSTNILTPNLTELANSGMLFENFYSQPLCGPARAGFQTGQYPSRFGFRLNCAEDSNRGLPEGLPTIANAFKTGGYKTYHIGKWHLGHSSDKFHPNERGNDYFFGFLYGPYVGTDFNNPRLMENKGEYKPYPGNLEDILATKAVSIIKQQKKGQPFFINYWSTNPHAPYFPTISSLNQYPNRKSEESKYAASITDLDKSIGRIKAEIKKMGLERDTIIMFFSDNGAQIDLHPGINNSGLNGRKNFIYEGGIKSPFIISWPGKIAPGSTTKELVMSIDLIPTLSKVIGLNTTSYTLDGVDVSPVFSGGKAPVRNLFWDHGSGDDLRGAVRQGNLKYVYDKGKEYLFDLNKDPGEKTNISASNSAKFIELKSFYWNTRVNTSKYSPIQFQAANQGNVSSSQANQVTEYAFGNQNQALIYKDHSQFNPDTFEMSFSTWFLPKKLTQGRIVGKAGAWRLEITNNGTIELQWRDKNNVQITHLSSQKAKLNQWNHLVFTFDNAHDKKARVYLNNIRVINADYTGTLTNTADVYIGNSNALVQPLQGNLRIPTFYSASLRPDEVTNLFLKGPNKP